MPKSAVGLQPVTAKERAIWMFHQYLPGEGVLNMSFAVEPVAELDQAALQAAVTAMIRRHANLRTLFPAPDGEPFRLTLEPGDSLTEQVVRVLDVPAAAVGEESRRAISAGFDLTAELPVRVTVLRSGGPELIWVTVSHIVYDVGSQAVLRGELEAAYTALRSGGGLPAVLAEPAPAPAMRDPDAETLAYWHDVLADVHPGPDLDIGRPGGRAAGFPGSMLRQPVRPQTWTAVETVARRTSCPPSAVLLAGLATVLHRHGAGDDIVIALPTYNRGDPPHRAIGYYMSIAGVRVRLGPDTNFDELVRQCARQMLEGLQHLGASLDDAKPGAFEASAPDGRPLVRYLLNYLFDLPAESARGTVLRDGELHDGVHSRMDLQVFLQPGPEGRLLTALYAADLFSAAETEKLLGRLQAVLTSASGGGTVGTLDMRDDADRAAAGNAPATGPSQFPLVAEEITTSVFAYADGEAVLPGSGAPDLRYGDLAASAAVLAAELGRHGVIVGEPAGILARTLAGTVIGVLGCWAAGCPAVLLEAADGAADVGVIAATEPLGPGHVPIRHVTRSAAGSATPSYPVEPPYPDEQALTMTAGGARVVLSHAALATAVAALAAELPLTSRDLVAVGPAACSGPELLEVLLALAAGARVLPLAAAREEPAREALDRGASVLVTSPEVLDRLLARSGDRQWPGVRAVLRGGRLLPGLAGRARTAGISLLRVTGPAGPAGAVLAGTSPDDAGPGLLGHLPSAPPLRLAARSGAPALPLMRARLLDGTGTDVLGFPVRDIGGGWLETVDDVAPSAGDVDAAAASSGDQAADDAASRDTRAAQALGIDFVALWRTLLDRPEAGAEDSFFKLGGDSIRAGRLVAQVHKLTGVKMPLRAVFKSPTPAGFAAAVRAQAGD